MRYTSYINNAKCIEWGLNLAQGVLFDLIVALSIYQQEKTIFLPYELVTELLPSIFNTSDNVYRNMKVLIDKKVISRDNLQVISIKNERINEWLKWANKYEYAQTVNAGFDDVSTRELLMEFRK